MQRQPADQLRADKLARDLKELEQKKLQQSRAEERAERPSKVPRESGHPRRCSGAEPRERPSKVPRQGPWIPALPADEAEQSYQDNLIQEMVLLKRSDPEHLRRHCFMTQCHCWDPDKNSGNKQLSILMFQTLQAKKKWFLSDRF